MLKYLIRLDDACPTMNEQNWIKIEQLLDKYNIRPIVGIIPDNKDKDFIWSEISDFWVKYPRKWGKKGWTIAQHGCHHQYQAGVRSEFTGLNYTEQARLLNLGYDIMRNHGVIPSCFFAPNHKFDNVTVQACRNSGHYNFISDCRCSGCLTALCLNFLSASFAH